MYFCGWRMSVCVILVQTVLATVRKPVIATVRTPVHMAVLLPNDSVKLFASRNVLPAIYIARDKVRHLLPDHDVIIHHEDSKCNAAYSANHAFNLYSEYTMNVFLGPVCVWAVSPVARQSKFWQLPVITTGAFARDFRLTAEFEYLVRVGSNFESLAQYLVQVFRDFKWKKFKLIYNPKGHQTTNIEGYCHLMAESIHFGITSITNDTILQDYFKFEKWTQFQDKFEQEIGTNYSVVVLCASKDSVRKIMLKALDLNFVNGEYVFINIDLFSSKEETERPWYRKNSTDEENERAKNAYQALMTVTLRKPESNEYKNFSDDVKRRAEEKYPGFKYGEDEVNSFVGAFHDAVILYALALNKTLSEGGNITQGHVITQNMWNRTFQGITGNVSIDANGDRNADYSLLDLNPKTGKFEVVANYYGSEKRYVQVPNKVIYWADGVTRVPKDTPTCGFDGSLCPPEKPFPIFGIVIIIMGGLLILVVVAAFLIYRHYKLEAELAEMNWRIRWEDIMFGQLGAMKKMASSRLSLVRKYSDTSHCSADTIAVNFADAANRQLFTKTGYYKATIVAIKKMNKSRVEITKPLLKEVKKIKDMNNDHIVRFIGACIDPPNQCIITEYCPKGSLQDVLENEQIKLDWMFRYSLMQDIVRGMAYLHASDIRSHGNLKSSNCVVDSRFVVKITDFGLHCLRCSDDMAEEGTYAFYKKKLWLAPEILRLPSAPPEGSQKADVYSFGVICQEVVYRNGPFYMSDMDLPPEVIYSKVKSGAIPLLRPSLDDNECECTELAEMIKKCWAEDPHERPDFQSLKSIIRRLNKNGDTGNILDNLLSRMEMYANNLEALVDERTADYLEQKKRAEDLLYMMLPKSVAGTLIRGESVAAESFDSVTIYFSDICGFTALSSKSTPMQVIDLLNDLYTTFDSIIDSMDVYKVETIGDAYMVVSGLPVRNGTAHASEISRMALRFLDAILVFRIRHIPDDQLRLRIGIHTGSVCAGVVGHKMPRYCLFGDTVNTASRMESNGLPLKIHVSPDTKAVLDTYGTFDLELRGPVEMKGKGVVTTYWLVGERDDNKTEQLSHCDEEIVKDNEQSTYCDDTVQLNNTKIELNDNHNSSSTVTDKSPLFVK